MKINWKQKLTSRKFWMAVAAFITMLVSALGRIPSAAVRVTTIIMAGAAVVAYIIGESRVDAAAAAPKEDVLPK